MSDIQVIRSGFLQVNSLVVSLYGNKVFVVDPAACLMSGDSGKITEYLKAQNKECVAVVLTHSHFDHITGVSEIKKLFPDAVIAIHEEEKNELQNSTGPMNDSILRLFDMEEVLPVVAEQPAGEIFLKDKDDLSLLYKADCSSEIDEAVKKELGQWKVMHTPGHSPGSICIYNENKKLLISGDTLFEGTCGRTDMYGGNESQIRKSLRFLEDNIPAGVHVFPGHDRSFVM